MSNHIPTPHNKFVTTSLHLVWINALSSSIILPFVCLIGVKMTAIKINSQRLKKKRERNTAERIIKIKNERFSFYNYP